VNPRGAGSTHAVVVVEDNDDLRMTLVEILRQRGYEVREAADAEEGLRVARDDGADLVLLDLHLAEADSFGLLRHLLALSPAPTVVVMTGYPIGAPTARFLHTVTSAVLRKPFRPELLLQIVADTLDADPSPY